MLMHPSLDGKRAAPGQFQAAASETSASSSSHSYREARKKELEDELKRDLERLAEERKEGLHRIDWQLAEAVENLHAETVEKANKRIQTHKQVLAELEDSAVPSRLSSMAESTTARSEQVSPRSNADASGSVSSASESDEEEAGVWNHVVGFFNRGVPASGSIFAGAGSTGVGVTGFSDLASSLGLATLTSGAGVTSTGGSKASRSVPQPILTPSAKDQVFLESIGPGSSKGEPRSPMSRSPTSNVTSPGLGPKGQGSPHGARPPSSSESWRSSRATKAPPPPPPAPSPFPEDLPPRPNHNFFQAGMSGGQRQMGWY